MFVLVKLKNLFVNLNDEDEKINLNNDEDEKINLKSFGLVLLYLVYFY